MWNPFKSKTIWLSLASIVGAVGAYGAGEITWQVMAATILAALGLMFNRAGVAKNGAQK